VAGFTAGNALATRDEFVEALNQLMGEIERSRNAGIGDRLADDALVEVEAANREAKKEGGDCGPDH
jgi:hypothetical protein